MLLLIDIDNIYTRFYNFVNIYYLNVFLDKYINVF